MWLDIVLIAVIVVFAIIGIAKGFVDSVLSIFSTLVSLVIAYFLAKYVASFLNSICKMNELFAKMLGSWGVTEEGLAGFSREKIASLITFLVSMLIVWLLIKLAIFLLSKLFESVTANSSALSGLNRALGFLFGAVKGALFVCIALGVVSLCSSFGLEKPENWIKEHTTVTAAVYKYLDPWVTDNVAGMVKDWADKITGEESTPEEGEGEGSGEETPTPETPDPEEPTPEPTPEEPTEGTETVTAYYNLLLVTSDGSNLTFAYNA